MWHATNRTQDTTGCDDNNNNIERNKNETLKFGCQRWLNVEGGRKWNFTIGKTLYYVCYVGYVCVCNNLVIWYVGGSRMSEKWNRIFTIAFSICFVCSLSSSSHNRISLSSWFQLCYFQLSFFPVVWRSPDCVCLAARPLRWCLFHSLSCRFIGRLLGRRTWRTVAKFNFRFPIYTIHIHVLPMIIYYYFCLSTNCVRYDMTVNRIGNTRSNARDSCWWGCSYITTVVNGQRAEHRNRVRFVCQSHQSHMKS